MAFIDELKDDIDDFDDIDDYDEPLPWLDEEYEDYDPDLVNGLYHSTEEWWTAERAQTDHVNGGLIIAYSDQHEYTTLGRAISMPLQDEEGRSLKSKFNHDHHTVMYVKQSGELIAILSAECDEGEDWYEMMQRHRRMEKDLFRMHFPEKEHGYVFISHGIHLRPKEDRFSRSRAPLAELMPVKTWEDLAREHDEEVNHVG